MSTHSHTPRKKDKVHVVKCAHLGIWVKDIHGNSLYYSCNFKSEIIPKYKVKRKKKKNP